MPTPEFNNIADVMIALNSPPATDTKNSFCITSVIPSLFSKDLTLDLTQVSKVIVRRRVKALKIELF